MDEKSGAGPEELETKKSEKTVFEIQFVPQGSEFDPTLKGPRAIILAHGSLEARYEYYRKYPEQCGTYATDYIQFKAKVDPLFKKFCLIREVPAAELEQDKWNGVSDLTSRPMTQKEIEEYRCGLPDEIKNYAMALGDVAGEIAMLCGELAKKHKTYRETIQLILPRAEHYAQKRKEQFGTEHLMLKRFITELKDALERDTLQSFIGE